MCHFFIYSSVFRLLGCFHVLALVTHYFFFFFFFFFAFIKIERWKRPKLAVMVILHFHIFTFFIECTWEGIVSKILLFTVWPVDQQYQYHMANWLVMENISCKPQTYWIRSYILTKFPNKLIYCTVHRHILSSTFFSGFQNIENSLPFFSGNIFQLWEVWIHK